MEILNIRPASVSDAQGILELWDVLDSETEFLLYEPGERKITLKELQKHLEVASTLTLSHLVVLESAESKTLVGFAAGKRSVLERDKHNLDVVVALRQSYTAKGWGGKLLAELENWAKTQKIQRLELSVITSNLPAIKLYRKYGFQTEGIKSKAVRLKAGYFDLCLMAKQIV